MNTESRTSLGKLPTTTIVAKIEKTQNLTEDMLQVILRLPSEQNIRHYSGQYLECDIDGKITPFSIANSDAGDNTVELHIRNIPGNSNSTVVLNHCLTSTSLKIMVPKGNCVFNPNDTRPVIFICGSNGFSQMKAMLEEALAKNLTQSLYLYWGAQIPSDLYMNDLPEKWAQQHSQFNYIPVISNNTDQPWKGRTGLVHHAVLEDFPSLENFQVYSSGSPGMVYAIYDDFVAQGLDKNSMAADVFEYAPRP
ncbi:MAG: NAD(P)H-flavin reductase [Pseudomonadales bacterium]|nr:NAD(P)H-flavin reductase [Pseudomonadales bacterium]